MGLSVVIITKNEAEDLPRALDSVCFAEEVIVLDSGSTDGTQEIARDRGAKVFETEDWPGFGPQKNRALRNVTQEWVLSLDADEWLEPGLAEEIQQVIQAPQAPTSNTQCLPQAYRIKRRSIFVDKVMRFGDWRRDRVLRLFRTGKARFSDDLVHEKVISDGVVGELDGYLGHHSVRSIQDSLQKMRSYNQVAAQKIADHGRGGLINAGMHAAVSMFRSLILRVGFLDGWRGFQLAWMNARGTWIKYCLAGELQSIYAWRAGEQTRVQRLADMWHLMAVDHGFLRLLYKNLWRLPGGLFRCNQPSPLDLKRYKRELGIRTVINLRGENDQLGWYRLEKSACQALGIKLENFQIFSRGLIEKEDFLHLKTLIESVELPALVHCKSGADRAGFFSVMYRHIRLGEPVEVGQLELGLKFGHFKEARTGVLDFFFQSYRINRHSKESLRGWIARSFDKQQFDATFQPNGLIRFFVDRLLRRE